MEDLNKRIGQVCLNYSAIELMLSVFTARLISDDSKIGAILTSEMSYQNLIKAFDSLVRYKVETKPFLNELTTLIKRVNLMEKERNIVIHSVYGIADDGINIFRIKVTSKFKNGLSTKAVKINEDYFRKLTKEQVEILNELQNIYKLIFKTDTLNYA